jgi:DNA-binding CsgD family transcriptional regulator
MQHWIISSQASGMPIDSTNVCRLIGAIASSDRTALADAVLALVGPHIAIADCAVFAYEAERNPRLISASSRSNTWQMFHCASEYARDLFRHDRIQLHLRGLLPTQEVGSVVVHRQMLQDVVDPALRRFCESVGSVDGMAITVKTGRRQWVTTSLCRHGESGLLSDGEIKAVLQLASLIATSAANHCRLEADGESDFRTSVSDGLDELCPQLTTREREVILRILDGVTAERIADDLGIRPTTVITYRTRAYEKLGVSSRRELFSAVLRSRNAVERARPSGTYATDWASAPVALVNDSAIAIAQ